MLPNWQYNKWTNASDWACGVSGKESACQVGDGRDSEKIIQQPLIYRVTEHKDKMNP